MTQTLAVWLVLMAAAALALAALIVVWIVRDGGTDDGWESGHLDQLDAMLDNDNDDDSDPTEYQGQHYQVSGWGGVPGQCGVECACGVTFDGFDTIGEAAELLSGHVADFAAEARVTFCTHDEPGCQLPNYPSVEEYERRTLAASWRDQVTTPEVPQLAAIDARPYVPYAPRHADDTIEFHLVPDDWHPTIGARRIAASLDTTAQMQAVTP